MIGLAGVLALWLTPAPPAPQTPSERSSLEELLERARARRAELHARLLEEVQAVVARIDLEPLPASPQKRALLASDLVALGTEATPILMRWSDPGVAPEDRDRFRSAVVIQALARMDTKPVTGELLDLLERGSQQGRSNAVTVLRESAEVERVRPQLLRAFRQSTGQLREDVFQALVAKAHPDNQALLSEILGGEDPRLIDLALAIVTEVRSEAVAPTVRELLAASERASKHADALLLYFRNLPALAGEDEIHAFLRLAEDRSLSSEKRIELVESMLGFKPRLNAALRAALEPIVDDANRKVAEAALVLLAGLGDRPARRELLAPYDGDVSRNESWAPAYERRAEVLRRIADFDDAIKDYKRALELSRDSETSKPDTYIGLARCYALKGRLKDASDYL
ncbi:MAG TPA: tetratricopeptide repeat protein, partial [Candidatus Krumholzibacteria bacterium]